jgi:hypothetical protein
VAWSAEGLSHEQALSRAASKPSPHVVGEEGAGEFVSSTVDRSLGRKEQGNSPSGGTGQGKEEESQREAMASRSSFVALMEITHHLYLDVKDVSSDLGILGVVGRVEGKKSGIWDRAGLWPKAKKSDG